MRCFWLILLTYSLPLLSLGQQYGFDVFSREQRLPASGVYDMLQDDEGLLWIATQGGGLARFDGRDFEVISEAQGLPDNMVRALFEDAEGKIIVGTQKGLIAVNDTLGVQVIPALKGQHIRGITQDTLGLYWVSTLGKGVVCLDRDLNAIALQPKLPSANSRAVIRDSRGRIWIGTDSGLCTIKNERVVTFGTADGLTDEKILALYEGDPGEVWIATQFGLTLFNGDSLSSFMPSTFGDKRIRSVAKDGHGQLWVGTFEGLYRVARDQDQPVEFLGLENGLSNERIRKVIVDDHNALWVGTYFGGVCRLSNQQFAYFTREQGFPENNVTALFRDSTGNTWIGTYDGSVYVYDGKQINKRYTPPVSFSDDYVIDLEEPKPGNVWACTTSGRVELYENGEFAGRVFESSARQVTSIGSFNGEAVMCTANSGLIVGQLTVADTIGSCTTSLQLNDSTLAVGTTSGLCVIYFPTHAGKTRVFSPEKLRSTHITSLTSDSQGNLWCGTEGQGILRYRNEKFRWYNSSSYLQNPSINFVVLDDQENLWVGTDDGLDHIELTPDQSVVLDHSFFGPEEGFRGGETNVGAAFIDSVGNLWMGTVRGVVRQNHNLTSGFGAPPIIAIKRVMVNNSEIGHEYSSSLSLEPTENQLNFFYRGIDLAAPEQVRYQFKLEGLDGSWSAITTEESKEYASLPPGDYTFLVRSHGRGGNWNQDPAALSFSIATPFYQSGWFIGLVVLFFGGLLWMTIRLRLQYLEGERERLEIKVAERTSELNEEKHRTEELLHNILPRETARELRENGSAETRKYPMVSVLFSDFKGFTMLSEDIDPTVLVETLDACFRSYDRLTEEFGVEKIKTIGDAYMCASGLPVEDDQHAENLVQFALKMIEATEEVNARHKAMGKPIWQLRVGIHSGPVVAGVVGEKKFAYDIWGDTVNLAARMESSGEIGKVNISTTTYSLVRDKFDCTPRGKIAAKNKGEIEMFFVNNPKEKRETELKNEDLH